jgi:hypothetical protein
VYQRGVKRVVGKERRVVDVDEPNMELVKKVTVREVIEFRSI